MSHADEDEYSDYSDEAPPPAYRGETRSNPAVYLAATNPSLARVGSKKVLSPAASRVALASPSKAAFMMSDPNLRGTVTKQSRSGMFEGSKYNDWPFIFVFLACLAGVLVIIVMGLPQFHAFQNATAVGNGGVFGPLIQQAIIILCVLVGGGAACACFWLLIIKLFPKQIIYFSFFCMFLFLGAILVVIFMLTGSLIAVIVPGLFLLLLVLMFFLVRRRIPFAAAMIRASVQILPKYPGMLIVAIFTLLLQAACGVLFVFAYIILYVKYYDDVNVMYILAVYLLFTYMWVNQVVKNITHVTCAGTYASYYFLFNTTAMPSSPTVGAFKRTMTTAFGSVCFGSLIVAIISTIKFILKRSGNGRHSFVGYCCICLVGMLEDIMKTVNEYAFTQVAIYGKSYCDAARATQALLHRSGFELLANDNLISITIMITALLSALTTAIGAAVWLYLGYGVPVDAISAIYYWILFIIIVILAFLIGLAEATVLLEIVKSGTSCLFVCYAEEPRVLEGRMPELHQAFMNAITQVRPSP